MFEIDQKVVAITDVVKVPGVKLIRRNSKGRIKEVESNYITIDFGRVIVYIPTWAWNCFRPVEDSEPEYA